MLITSKMNTPDLMFNNALNHQLNANSELMTSSTTRPLLIKITELDSNDYILRVRGDTHIGGVIFQLVEQLNNYKNDWSNFALWWPEKNQWLNKTKMTLDQYGVQGDALLEFTRTHKILRVQLPDHQILEMPVDYSSCLFYSIKQICKDIGIRYSEELSLLKVSTIDNIKTTPNLQSQQSVKNISSPKSQMRHKEIDTNSVASSNTSTLNNSLSNNSSSLKFRSSNSQVSDENFNYDSQTLILSPHVSVHSFLTKECPKFKNMFDRTRINSRWLDSSISLMEQDIKENDLLQLRFKYYAFYELNTKLDSVRINQIYEQAKWSILSEEIECTEQELINFAALQLQSNLQTKNLLNGTYQTGLKNETDNEMNRSLNLDDSISGKRNKKCVINETAAIYEDDDVDTALSKLEKSLDVVQLSNTHESQNKENKTDNNKSEANGEFKLELAEELFLMKQQKLSFKKLKNFYFVLDSTCYLSYFKSKDDSKSGRPIDKISLKGSELVPDVNISNKKFGITLKVPSVEGMTEMSLRCPNEESYARWLSACKLASRNKTISDSAFKNETASILNLLQIQQNKLNGLDTLDSTANNNQKTVSVSSNTKSIDSRLSHFESNDNTQANNLVTLRMLKKYKVKQLNDKILEAYSAISHLDLNESKWHYIRSWQALPSYGISYFTVKIRGSRQKEDIIGIASNRLMRISNEGETIKTWRFNAMKSWNVNWEIKQFEIIFDEELVVFTCLNFDPKILHEFIGGYIYLSLRTPDKNNQIDQDMFLKLTEKR